MRISTIMVIWMCVAASITYAERGHAQRLSDYKLNLSIGDESLHAVLTKISEQTRISFAYDQQALDNVTVRSAHYTNEPLDQALQSILVGTGYQYEVLNRNVVISKKPIPKPQKPGKITGRVTDADTGEPLEGVTLLLSPSGKSTLTDASGSYQLDVMPGIYALSVTYIGYESSNRSRIEVVDGESTVVDLMLANTTSELDEVVVVGYGEVQRKDLTGSVGQVSMEDIVKAPVTSFDEALAGRVAGVQVTSNDGQPGSLPNIIIRGGNSITQDNSPLYIVDGFPLEGNDNSAINPNDIASIDILKDASATAIYGARGANGVVIITTKKGKAGEPAIAFDTYFGLQNDIKRVKLLDSYEFVRLQLELDPTNATELYLTQPNRTLEDYREISGIDWYEKVLQTAPMHNHNLSLRGGTQQTKYAVSGSILDQQGIFVSTGFKRYQGRLILEQQIGKKLKLGVNANYAHTNQLGTIVTEDNGGAGANIMNNIWAYRPVITVSEEDIEFEEQLIDPEINPASTFRVNPLLELENALRERIRKNMLVNANLDYSLNNEFKIRITGGMNKWDENRNSFNNSKTRSGSVIFPFSMGVNGSRVFVDQTTFTNENTLNYTKRINDTHRIDAVAGFTQQLYRISSYGASAFQIPNEELGLSGLDQGIPRTVESRLSNWAMKSFLGRINYHLLSKFLFTATFRADGSSKFAKGNQWAYFPSGAFAYRLGEEAFIKNSRVISDAKLRVSYGTTGNNRVSDFAYLSEMVVGLPYAYSFGNELPTQGAVANNLSNPELRWETTQQFDFGFDLSLFGEKLNVTGDYYYKKTNDLLLRAQLPNSSGYLRAFKNVGAVSNSGVEFSIQANTINTDVFRWTSAFNISFNRNKVLALTDGQQQLTSNIAIVGSVNNSVYVAEIGKPVAQFYGLRHEGVYQPVDFNTLDDGSLQLKDEIPANGGPRGQIRPGDAKYVDLNGDGNINLDDYTAIGNPNPDFFGGLNNNFFYKGFDLNVFFQFSYGNEIFNANKVNFENGRQVGVNSNQFASMANRWTPDNPTSNIPAINRLGGNFYSTRSIENGSYLRLKTVSLGYNIPFSGGKYIHVKSARVHVAAQNLFTWSSYSGIDPEVSTRHSALTPGFDLSPYPRMRTITLGLNVTF